MHEPEQIFVKPAKQSVVVLNNQTGRRVCAEGELVFRDRYMKDRIKDKDLVVVKQTKSKK